MSETFTIGIEEEFQIVDPHSGELRSHVAQMMEEGRLSLGDRIKPEMHQAVIEVGTGICKNIQQARDDVLRARQTVAEVARHAGLAMVAAGTHPFSDWRVQDITEHERYKEIVEDLQDIARSNLIFGLHVHIGISDRNLAIDIMNAARYFLPHVLALSTNSPFWLGRNTGFKSTRTTIFKRFPRTGIPEYFGSYAEYESYISTLVRTHCIDNGRKIWWDVRPHSIFDTIEFRICDIPMFAEETITLAALFQAIVAKLVKLRESNMGFRLYRRALIEENKWRAARYGLDGKLIDFGKKIELSARELIPELLHFVDDVLDDLGSRREVEAVFDILKNGTGADRQLRVYQETGDLRKVVHYLMHESLVGVC
ncbi:MAG: carboxylate-amine ligase [Armatimonadetes bacterium]|nr:carboxylate-amine ligase [Armatimonadota bacterium]